VKEAWRLTPKWITILFFAFSKRTQLRFEGNRKIPLVRQVKRSEKGRARI
jgi:hypothetical protein